MSKTDLRLFGAAIAIVLWLVLLSTGWALGGLVHLLLAVGLVLVPWRDMPRTSALVVDRSEQTVGKGGDREAEQESVRREKAAHAVEDEAGD